MQVFLQVDIKFILKNVQDIDTHDPFQVFLNKTQYTRVSISFWTEIQT